MVGELPESNVFVYHNLYHNQNAASQELLKAVVQDGCVAELASGEFLVRHGFTSPSTVRFAISDLIDANLLYRPNAGYVVHDRFFGYWLKDL